MDKASDSGEIGERLGRRGEVCVERSGRRVGLALGEEKLVG